jgi:small GTP-binding protein
MQCSAVETVHARVVVIGDSTVGKTSILNSLVSHTFNQHESPTVVSNFKIYAEDVGGVGVELQIWDTAGQGKFRSLGPIYFRNAIAALVVYDRTNRASFEHLGQWIDDFVEIAGGQTVIAIAGNKLDLVDGVEVGIAEAEEWARPRGCIIAETSALTGVGVQDLFREFVAAILKIQTTNRLAKIQQESDVEEKQTLDHEVRNGCNC